VDGYVLLTPLLVLVVILLLGFTGCQLVFPAIPPRTLTLRARVPSEFTILESLFQWTPPGASTPESDSELDRRDDGPEITELSRLIGDAAAGSWTVLCRLRVSVATPTGGREATDDVTGTFTLDSSSENSFANFETTGSPASVDFRVLFTGLVSD
jgi:hypothetical protein